MPINVQVRHSDLSCAWRQILLRSRQNPPRDPATSRFRVFIYDPNSATAHGVFYDGGNRWWMGTKDQNLLLPLSNLRGAVRGHEAQLVSMDD